MSQQSRQQIESIDTDTHSVTTIAEKGCSFVLLKISIDLNLKNQITDVTQELYGEFLLSGTKKQNREEFLDSLNKIGASFTVAITDRVLNINIKSTSEAAGKALALFEEMFTTPAFAASELTRIKKLYDNKLTDREEEAKFIAHQKLKNNLYRNNDRHCFALPGKLREQLEDVVVADFKSLHERVREGFICATISGNESVIKKAAAMIDRIAATTAHPYITKTALAKPKKHIELINIPSKQNIEFSIGAALPITVHHPDYRALVFGLAVLGLWGGFTGRLMSTVREKEGLTYGIYARCEGLEKDELGYWRIMTFFSPEKAAQGLTSTFRELTNIVSKGITEDEYKRFRVILNTRQTLTRDSLAQYTEVLHQFKLLGIPHTEVETFQEKLLKVNVKEVNQALKQYIDPQSVLIVGAGPVAAVKQELTSLSTKIR